MDKIELLLREWDFCYDEEDWYPPLLEALKGLTAALADWRPEGGSVNTIWETVNHLIFYKERLLTRLSGEEPTGSGITNDDTFAVAAKEDADWEETLSRLKEVHSRIREHIALFKEEDFERPLPKQPVGLTLTSLVFHDAYHTGQIIQLRKLQGSWPSRRAFD